MKEGTLHGSLTFLGFIISDLAVLYFAMEYMPLVADWTRVIALIFLALMFAFLGAYLRQTVLGEPFFEGPRLRWLRPAVVMYLSAIITGIAAELAFLGLDGIDRPLKILLSLIVGIGLIIAVATRHRKEAPEARPDQQA